MSLDLQESKNAALSLHLFTFSRSILFDSVAFRMAGIAVCFAVASADRIVVHRTEAIVFPGFLLTVVFRAGEEREERKGK